jgi:hypothetical protein
MKIAQPSIFHAASHEAMQSRSGYEDTSEFIDGIDQLVFGRRICALVVRQENSLKMNT